MASFQHIDPSLFAPDAFGAPRTLAVGPRDLDGRESCSDAGDSLRERHAFAYGCVTTHYKTDGHNHTSNIGKIFDRIPPRRT